MRKSLILSAVSVASLLAPLAVAQDARGVDDEAEARLGTVTVRARRVEESVQDVPISITVVGAEDFLNKGLFEFTDIADITPGLALTGEKAGVNFISIRGVGNLGTASPLSPSVSVFIDQAATPDASFLISSTLDISAVEVLSGPQGTLYGTNATAGAINIYSTDPMLNGESNAYVQWTYAVYEHNGNNSYELEGATDITFVEDVFGVRLAGSLRRDEGAINNPFIQESVSQSNQDNVRAKFLFTPNEAFKSTLTLGYYEGRSQEVFTVDVPRELSDGNFGNFDLFDYRTSQEPPKTPEDLLYGVLNMNLETPLGNLTSVTSYFEQTNSISRDADNVAGAPDVIQFDFDRELFTQEVRLAGDAFDGRFSYLVGGYYQYAARDTQSLIDFTPTGTLPVPFDDQGGGGSRDTWAAFTNNSFRLTDQLTLSGGLRVETVKIDVLDPFQDISASILSVALGGGIVGGVVDDELSDTNVATSLKLAYEPNDKVTFYAGYDQAFRVGGFNTTTTPAFVDAGFSTFDTETTDAFEVGFKTNGLLHKNLRLNAAAYYQTFDDYQFQTFGPVQFADITPTIQAIFEGLASLPPGTLQTFGYPTSDGVFVSLPTLGLVINAPEAENTGFEFSFEFDATDNWTFGGSFSSNDFKFVDFTGVPTNQYDADIPISADPTLSALGLGTAFAGQNSQAALNALSLILGPLGTVTGDVVSASTIPTRDLSGTAVNAGSNQGQPRPYGFTLNGEYRTDVSLWGEKEAFVRAIYAYNKADPDRSPSIFTSSGVLNVFAGLTDEESGWSAQLFVTNLLNDEYVTSLSVDIDMPNGPRGLPAAPRQVGVTLRKNF